MAKMTVEDARDKKEILENTILVLLEKYTKETGIVITKMAVKMSDVDEDPAQIQLMDLSVYVGVDTMAVL